MWLQEGRGRGGGGEVAMEESVTIKSQPRQEGEPLTLLDLSTLVSAPAQESYYLPPPTCNWVAERGFPKALPHAFIALPKPLINCYGLRREFP